MYFGPDQESAVRVFLTATTWDQKNKVYNEFIQYPFDKLAENIIHTFKFCSICVS